MQLDYESERERLKRRRAVSDALLMQSQQPMGGTEMVSGRAVRRSPLEGLAKLAQAYQANQQGKQIDTDQAALQERQRGDMVSALDEYRKATSARPGSSEQIMDEEANGGEGALATITAPPYAPTAGDQRSAAMNLMGKIGDPRDAAKMMVADALKPRELKTGKPGDVFYDPATGQQQGSIPAAQKYHTVGGALVPEPSAPGQEVKPVYSAPEKVDYNKPFLPDGKPNPAYQRYELDKVQRGATKVSTTIRENDKKFEKEDKLRADYTSNPKVKASAEMDSAFKMIEAAYQNPTAANDLAMATKYMKILDPTSVVRESEFALAVSATGLLDKVQNYAASVLQGKKLNPTQRKDFYESAKAINDSFQQGRATVDSEYSEIATGYGLEPKNVIPSLRSKSYAGPERRGLPSADAIDAELRRRAGGG